LLLIELSIQRPARMPLYAFLAALGSVLGCVLLYLSRERGGEALFHKRGRRGMRTLSGTGWNRTGLSEWLIAALLAATNTVQVLSCLRRECLKSAV